MFGVEPESATPAITENDKFIRDTEKILHPPSPIEHVQQKIVNALSVPPYYINAMDTPYPVEVIRPTTHPDGIQITSEIRDTYGRRTVNYVGVVVEGKGSPNFRVRYGQGLTAHDVLVALTNHYPITNGRFSDVTLGSGFHRDGHHYREFIAHVTYYHHVPPISDEDLYCPVLAVGN
jgi:hypothetical protein